MSDFEIRYLWWCVLSTIPIIVVWKCLAIVDIV